jgi:hypothetical protein
VASSFFKIRITCVVFGLSLLFGNFLAIDAQRNSRAKAVPTPAATTTAPPEINFTVSMTKPWTHLLEVEMRLRQPTALPAQTDVVMPVWTPGSYLVREYARHVLDFAVKDQNGSALNWDKTNKNIWRITTNGASEIIISYKVYANELTVRTNELNDEHAFFTPAALLMHPKDNIAAHQRSASCRLVTGKSRPDCRQSKIKQTRFAPKISIFFTIHRLKSQILKK